MSKFHNFCSSISLISIIILLSICTYKLINLNYYNSSPTDDIIFTETIAPNNNNFLINASDIWIETSINYEHNNDSIPSKCFYYDPHINIWTPGPPVHFTCTHIEAENKYGYTRIVGTWVGVTHEPYDPYVEPIYSIYDKYSSFKMIRIQPVKRNAYNCYNDVIGNDNFAGIVSYEPHTSYFDWCYFAITDCYIVNYTQSYQVDNETYYMKDNIERCEGTKNTLQEKTIYYNKYNPSIYVTTIPEKSINVISPVDIYHDYIKNNNHNIWIVFIITVSSLGLMLWYLLLKCCHKQNVNFTPNNKSINSEMESCDSKYVPINAPDELTKGDV